jgi:hypothetical protein
MKGVNRIVGGLMLIAGSIGLTTEPPLIEGTIMCALGTLLVLPSIYSIIQPVVQPILNQLNIWDEEEKEKK